MKAIHDDTADSTLGTYAHGGSSRDGSGHQSVVQFFIRQASTVRQIAHPIRFDEET